MWGFTGGAENRWTRVSITTYSATTSAVVYILANLHKMCTPVFLNNKRSQKRRNRIVLIHRFLSWSLSSFRHHGTPGRESCVRPAMSRRASRKATNTGRGPGQASSRCSPTPPGSWNEAIACSGPKSSINPSVRGIGPFPAAHTAKPYGISRPSFNTIVSSATSLTELSNMSSVSSKRSGNISRTDSSLISTCRSRLKIP